MYTLNQSEVMIMDVKDLIMSIEGSVKEYHNLLDQVEKPDYGTKSAAEPFQLRELVATIADIQDEVVSYRLLKILREEHPYIPQIKPDQIRLNVKRTSSSLKNIASNFLNQRKELLRILYTLPSENWNRTGVHEVEGHVSFKELIRRMIDKDQEVMVKLTQLSGEYSNGQSH